MNSSLITAYSSRDIFTSLWSTLFIATAKLSWWSLIVNEPIIYTWVHLSVQLYSVFTSQQKVFPWVISEIISNLPINIGFASLFATILYFMCNFCTDNLTRHLFVFITECILVQLGSTAFALIAASLARVCKLSWIDQRTWDVTDGRPR